MRILHYYFSNVFYVMLSYLLYDNRKRNVSLERGKSSNSKDAKMAW